MYRKVPKPLLYVSVVGLLKLKKNFSTDKTNSEKDIKVDEHVAESIVNIKIEQKKTI